MEELRFMPHPKPRPTSVERLMRLINDYKAAPTLVQLMKIKTAADLITLQLGQNKSLLNEEDGGIFQKWCRRNLNERSLANELERIKKSRPLEHVITSKSEEKPGEKITPENIQKSTKQTEAEIHSEKTRKTLKRTHKKQDLFADTPSKEKQSSEKKMAQKEISSQPEKQSVGWQHTKSKTTSTKLGSSFFSARTRLSPVQSSTPSLAEGGLTTTPSSLEPETTESETTIKSSTPSLVSENTIKPSVASSRGEELISTPISSVSEVTAPTVSLAEEELTTTPISSVSEVTAPTVSLAEEDLTTTPISPVSEVTAPTLSFAEKELPTTPTSQVSEVTVPTVSLALKELTTPPISQPEDTVSGAALAEGGSLAMNIPIPTAQSISTSKWSQRKPQAKIQQTSQIGLQSFVLQEPTQGVFGFQPPSLLIELANPGQELSGPKSIEEVFQQIGTRTKTSWSHLADEFIAQEGESQDTNAIAKLFHVVEQQQNSLNYTKEGQKEAVKKLLHNNLAQLHQAIVDYDFKTSHRKRDFCEQLLSFIDHSLNKLCADDKAFKVQYRPLTPFFAHFDKLPDETRNDLVGGLCTRIKWCEKKPTEIKKIPITSWQMSPLSLGNNKVYFLQNQEAGTFKVLQVLKGNPAREAIADQVRAIPSLSKFLVEEDAIIRGVPGQIFFPEGGTNSTVELRLIDYCKDGDLKCVCRKAKDPHQMMSLAFQCTIQATELVKEFLGQSLAHTDIKGENFLLNNGKVVISDLKCFRPVSNAKFGNEVIQTTPLYAPPEYHKKVDCWMLKVDAGSEYTVTSVGENQIKLNHPKNAKIPGRASSSKLILYNNEIYLYQNKDNTFHKIESTQKNTEALGALKTQFSANKEWELIRDDKRLDLIADVMDNPSYKNLSAEPFVVYQLGLMLYDLAICSIDKKDGNCFLEDPHFRINHPTFGHAFSDDDSKDGQTIRQAIKNATDVHHMFQTPEGQKFKEFIMTATDPNPDNRPTLEVFLTQCKGLNLQVAKSVSEIPEEFAQQISTNSQSPGTI